jgi:PAS domain-containing protein
LVLSCLAALALAGGSALHWRRAAAAVRAEAEADRQQLMEVLDAVDIGLVVCDRDDRVRFWNADYARMYPGVAPRLRAGMSFEALLGAVVEAGDVPEADGDPAGWIARRMAEHRRPHAPLLRRMPGGRWRRITERFLSDGGMVSYSHDVTDLVEQRKALQAAQQNAERAAARLEDAIEALPAAFELYDAEDRLVMVNARMLEQFPRIADLARSGWRFEELLREHARRGGLAEVPLPLEEWIRQRLAERARADGRPSVWRSEGRWIRVHEQRTRDGGLVGVRLDISAEVEQRLVAERADQRLRDAIEALPDGFAMYDADDRLVVCNERYRTLYRESAPAMRPGARFEEILRFGLERGQYPEAAGRDQAWLAERLRTHREPGPPMLQELPGNRWLRIDERRTPDGCLVGVRSDVTALVRREQALGPDAA